MIFSDKKLTFIDSGYANTMLNALPDNVILPTSHEGGLLLLPTLCRKDISQLSWFKNHLKNLLKMPTATAQLWRSQYSTSGWDT